MNAEVYSPTSGIDSYDNVSMSGLPPLYAEASTLADDLAFVVQPSMGWIQEVSSPGSPADVAIWLTESVRLEEAPADGFGDRHYRRNSLLLIPSGLPSRWVSPGGMPGAIHLHMRPSFRARWCDDLGLRDGSLAPLSNVPLQQAGASLQRVRAALREGSGLSRLEMQVAALDAAHACLTAQLGFGRRSAGQSMTPGRLRRVREYVEDNLSAEVCIEDMAACVGLSSAHFSRAFSAEMGVSPYAWVVRARVERVKDLLRNSRRPLAEIALHCGFASQSHMTETFRRATGLPPARWRKEMQGDPLRGGVGDD